MPTHARARVTPLTAIALVAALLTACGPARGGAGGAPLWPDSLPAAAALGARRDLTPVRAAIHVHSVWSHDACDGEPADSAGRANERCLARLRSALCRVNVDVLFLTEHDRRLGEADSLRDALLFREDDQAIVVDGRLAAKRQRCPGGGSVIWLAGAENALMPVGFDSLPRRTARERQLFYDQSGPGAADSFRAYGAVALLPHAEDLEIERVLELDPDGIEVFNPHAVFAPKHRESQGLSRLGGFARLLPFYARVTRTHPDLALLPIFRANRRAVDAWDALLARRAAVAVGASDAHENALPWPLADGERGDAYERMLAWVTNVLLVDRSDAVAAGDVRAIEDALRRGRSFVAIEAWGSPVGFDFRLESREGTVEMGGEVPFRPGQVLIVAPPRASLGGWEPGARSALPQPEVRARLYRIDERGRRSIVAESRGTIFAPVTTPGAYRAEVGIVPRHLGPYLGSDDDLLREVVWVYSNAIRVR